MLAGEGEVLGGGTGRRVLQTPVSQSVGDADYYSDGSYKTGCKVFEINGCSFIFCILSVLS